MYERRPVNASFGCLHPSCRPSRPNEARRVRRRLGCSAARLLGCRGFALTCDARSRSNRHRPNSPRQRGGGCGLPCTVFAFTCPSPKHSPVLHLSFTRPTPVLYPSIHLSFTCPSPVLHLSFTCPSPVLYPSIHLSFTRPTPALREAPPFALWCVWTLKSQSTTQPPMRQRDTLKQKSQKW